MPSKYKPMDCSEIEYDGGLSAASIVGICFGAVLMVAGVALNIAVIRSALAPEMFSAIKVGTLSAGAMIGGSVLGTMFCAMGAGCILSAVKDD